MSGNRRLFYELDETITGKVRFGDDSRVDIVGKGSVRFIIKGGDKKVLNNVYYIPALRSNIEFGTSHRGGMRSEHEGQHIDVTRSERAADGQDNKSK